MSAVDDLENFGLRWDKDLVSEENARTEVSGLEDDMVKADSGELALTGLSRCLGVLVYDSSSGKGYAAHVKTADKTSRELAEYLADFNTLLDAETTYEDLEIMVAGVDYSPKISDRFLGGENELEVLMEQSEKRGIAEAYADRYFADSQVKWEVDEGKTSGIVLDMDEGILEHDPSYDDR